MSAENCRLRKGRSSEPNRIYLLTSVVDQRRPVFSDWRLGRLVVDQFRKAQDDGQATSLAWVAMPDHFHWLIHLHKGSLAELMCQMKSRSSRAIKERTGIIHGRVWQRSYHDRALRREEDLKACARYIVMNPIRAGLVNKVGDYPLWDAIWL